MTPKPQPKPVKEHLRDHVEEKLREQLRPQQLKQEEKEWGTTEGDRWLQINERKRKTKNTRRSVEGG